MPRYWLVCGDQEDLVIAPDKKSAHEKGQGMFPGEPVEVFAAEERRLLAHVDDFDDDVSAAVEDIEYEVKEDTDLDILFECVDRIERAAARFREALIAVEWGRSRRDTNT